MHEAFNKFAHRVSRIAGSPWAFVLALAGTILWAVMGPVFHYSDTWQLTINTGTTILTFLIVFLIQNSQNRDACAIHLKLDELIRAIEGARNKLVTLEDMTDEELDALKREFECLSQRRAETIEKQSKRIQQ